ncbi:hypothetical protein, partial [Limnospira sp. PMC 289.06]|uniref:hypothetical protein n=1 Tax=Limnospira sp. PMC 289.06 TaxID=2981094 RepID=UPI0028E0C96A|nr:hypothetical protein [Limnospira sp. PMC 289.06]
NRIDSSHIIRDARGVSSGDLITALFVGWVSCLNPTLWLKSRGLTYSKKPRFSSFYFSINCLQK